MAGEKREREFDELPFFSGKKLNAGVVDAMEGVIFHEPNLSEKRKAEEVIDVQAQKPRWTLA